MKPFALVLSCALFSSSTFAVHFEVELPEDMEVMEVQARNVMLPVSVGDFTLRQMNDTDRSSIRDYEISNAGEVTSINGVGKEDVSLPSGGSRHFGWCYTVNGVLPKVTADQMMITDASDSVRWFYGYVDFQNGSWGELCIPAERP